MTAYVQQNFIKWYAAWCSSCATCTLSMLHEDEHSIEVQCQNKLKVGEKDEQEGKQVLLLVCLSLCKLNWLEAHTPKSLCSL